MPKPHPKRPDDIGAGLLFIVFGGAFAMGALRYPLGDSMTPGPGYMALRLGVLLALIGVVLVLRGWLWGAPAQAHHKPVMPWRWRPLLAVLSAVALCAVLLPRLGLMLTLPLTVLLASMASGRLDRAHWRGALITAVVVTVGTAVVMVGMLDQSLPLWPVGWTVT